MSGLDLTNGVKIRKGAFDSIKEYVRNLGGEIPSDLDEKVNEIMADVEKQRVAAFSGLLERGGILHLFYIYSLLIVNQHIIVPYITAFSGKAIYVQPVPEELTYLVLGLGSVILGKKHLDKRGGK